VQAQTQIGWALSPQPYALTQKQWQIIEPLGDILWQYLQACQKLFKAAQQTPDLKWLLELFERGKPSNLITFSQMNRFKNQYQLVIRPDFLVTPQGLTITEIDTCPGGIGFTAALQKGYSHLGFDVVGCPDIAQAFLSMLLEAYPKKTENAEPSIAIIVSDDFEDYRLELTWLISQLTYSKIKVIHPKQLSLRDTTLGYLDAEEFTAIDLVYRMFELYDLPNIPQIELLQFAIKKGFVFCTPPFKSFLEEKFCLALVHAPILKGFWLEALGDDALKLMQSIVPESWILDNTPLPYQAYLEPPLYFGNRRYQNLTQLGQLSQKERELVIKPSSFSHLAWGSHGITIGHDVSSELWKTSLNQVLEQNELVYLLQRFHNTTVEPYEQFDSTTGNVVLKEGRTRLCPYYFVNGTKPELAKPQLVGILATTCPKDKKIIHGMRDGVMRPAILK
jgi:hypothetical protein